MQFACGKRKQEKRKQSLKWHKWFALWPVKVGKNDCRWLEYVERKCLYKLEFVYYDMCPDEVENRYDEFRALRRG